MKLMKLTPTRGFTLIELIVTVAILGIIAAFAVPAYQTQAAKSKRSDAIALLMDVAAKQERYIQDNPSIGFTDDMTKLGFPADPATSEKGYYKVDVSTLAGDKMSYTLTATAQASQASDVCGNLTLTSKGVRGSSASSNCW